MEKHGIARQARDDNIIQLTRFACWITKATGTHAEHVILTEFLRHLHVTFTRTLPVFLKGEHLLNKSQRILFLLARQIKGTRT